LLILPVFVVVVFVGQQNGARPPWDILFIAVAALMLAAGSVFTALSIVMAMRHTAADAAAANPTPATLTGNLPLRVLGAGVLIANLADIMISGHANPLNWVLGALVVALLLLLRDRARRDGIKSRKR
jgi:hypothetical protein